MNSMVIKFWSVGVVKPKDTGICEYDICKGFCLFSGSCLMKGVCKVWTRRTIKCFPFNSTVN